MLAYQDSSLATAVRVADLLARMTLAEKVGQGTQRPATETVQLSVRDLLTSVTWADKEPKGFQEITVALGRPDSRDISLFTAPFCVVP